MNTLHSLKPRIWFTLAIVLYLLALLQNVLLPMGNSSVILTAILSLGGSLALAAGIFLPRLRSVVPEVAPRASARRQKKHTSKP